MRSADDRPDPWSPFAMRAVLLILASTIAAGICAFTIFTYASARSTCGCSGDTEGVRLVQRVVALAGGVDAWNATRAMAWTSPDGSQHVWDREKEYVQVIDGDLTYQSTPKGWGLFDFEGKDWEVTGPAREERGLPLLEKHRRSMLATFLPHLLCAPSGQIARVERRADDGDLVRLRFVSDGTRSAELEAVEIVVDPARAEIVRANLIGEGAGEVRYARWARAGEISTAVFEGADDAAHTVEVFDKEPFDRWIMGRN